MIRLRPDCLVFELSNGEKIPCSAEEMAIEIISSPDSGVEAATIREAAAAVLHYFRVELGRVSVSIGEFTGALKTALKALGFDVRDEDAHSLGAQESAASSLSVSVTAQVGSSPVSPEMKLPDAPELLLPSKLIVASKPSVQESVLANRRSDLDLADLGHSAGGSELQFFHVLRVGLKDRLKDAPNILVCRGLRDAAKHLCAAQRWSAKCQATSDQIVEYVRAYLEIEPTHRHCVLCVL